MSGSQTVGVMVLLFFAALLAAGLALHLTGRGYLLSALWAHSRAFLSEWGDRLRADLVARNARNAEAGAARRREKELGIEVGLAPSTVVDRAVEFMTRANYGIESRTDNAATFARHQGADQGIGCFLMLFFLLPGILYLLLAQKTVRVTMAAYPHESGSRVVIGGDDREDVGRLEAWVRSSRHLTPEDLPAVEPPQSGQIVGRLRELAELKEAGLVTQEEYEAKRRDLLDKM